MQLARFQEDRLPACPALLHPSSSPLRPLTHAGRAGVAWPATVGRLPRGPLFIPGGEPPDPHAPGWGAWSAFRPGAIPFGAGLVWPSFRGAEPPRTPTLPVGGVVGFPAGGHPLRGRPCLVGDRWSSSAWAAIHSGGPSPPDPTLPVGGRGRLSGRGPSSSGAALPGRRPLVVFCVGRYSFRGAEPPGPPRSRLGGRGPLSRRGSPPS